ncbi:MAG: TolC family protein [Pirellulales bacterium]|nr:TolC family protein [Pirellulales bacterium]
MSVPQNAVIPILLAAAIVTGCKCPNGGCVPATPTIPCRQELGFADGEPPELARLVPECATETCIVTPLPTPSETYMVLAPDECQCTAAANCNTANMIELERHWAKVIIECDSKYVARNQCLFRDLLSLHAIDLRNKAAADALTAYYQLAGLEAQSFFLDRAIDESRTSLERAEEIEKSGLPISVNRGDVAASYYDLLDRRVQLQLQRLQLNGQVKKLVGCPVEEQPFVWPRIDWRPDLTPRDPADDVAEGLATRYDLRGLYLLHCNLERRTLRVARGVLQMADGTLGAVEPTEGLVHRLRCLNCYESELPIRCRQVAMLLTDTENLAIGEIKGASYEIASQQQRVLYARQRVAQRREQLYRLTAKRDVDDSSALEISQARTLLYEAEGELVARVTALKLAETQLKRAQGVLALECGFAPSLCTEGCCNGPCTQCQPPTCCPDRCPCSRCKNL